MRRDTETYVATELNLFTSSSATVEKPRPAAAGTALCLRALRRISTPATAGTERNGRRATLRMRIMLVATTIVFVVVLY